MDTNWMPVPEFYGLGSLGKPRPELPSYSFNRMDVQFHANAVNVDKYLDRLHEAGVKIIASPPGMNPEKDRARHFLLEQRERLARPPSPDSDYASEDGEMSDEMSLEESADCHWLTISEAKQLIDKYKAFVESMGPRGQCLDVSILVNEFVHRLFDVDDICDSSFNHSIWSNSTTPTRR